MSSSHEAGYKLCSNRNKIAHSGLNTMVEARNWSGVACKLDWLLQNLVDIIPEYLVMEEDEIYISVWHYANRFFQNLEVLSPRSCRSTYRAITGLRSMRLSNHSYFCYRLLTRGTRVKDNELA